MSNRTSHFQWLMPLAIHSTLALAAHASPTLSWDEFSNSAFIETTRNGNTFSCSGVAIGQKVVLTSAHCVDGISSAIVSTDHIYKKEHGTFARVTANGIRIHPGYNPGRSLFKNDIAVLLLDNALLSALVEVSAQIQAASSPVKLERIGFGGRNGENRRTWTEVILESEIDGTFFSLDSLSVAGDSGGPLYQRHAGHLRLVGIHSTAIADPIGNQMMFRSAAVSITAHAEWIRSASGITLH